jgi:hypothetical protein
MILEMKIRFFFYKKIYLLFKMEFAEIYLIIFIFKKHKKIDP